MGWRLLVIFSLCHLQLKTMQLDYNKNANIELKKLKTHLHLPQITLIKLVGKKINLVFIKLNLKKIFH